MAPVDLERPVLRAEMFLPHELSGEIDRRDLAGREPGVDALAVGHRTRRRKVVFLVNRRQRAFGRKLELPGTLAAGPIECA